AGELVVPEASFATLARVMAAHPVQAVESCASHVVKFVLLPDNLDTLAYLGVYERTGVRASLVETHGWLGALVDVLHEMPLPVLGLLAGIVFFAAVWVAAVRGAVLYLRGHAAMERWIGI